MTVATISVNNPGVFYVFRVAAYNQLNQPCDPQHQCMIPAVGGIRGYSPYSSTVQILTPVTVPGAPRSVNISNIQASSAFVSWLSPDPSVQYAGVINQYFVYAEALIDSNNRTGLNLPSTIIVANTSTQLLPTLNVILYSLSAFTTYSVSVAAAVGTSVGFRTNPVIIQTLEDVPTVPQSFTARIVGMQSVQLNWTIPDPAQGKILYYVIGYAAARNPSDVFTANLPAPINGSQISVIFDGLDTNVVYQFYVSGASIMGVGPETANITVTTVLPSTSSSASSSGISQGGVAGIVIVLAIVVIVLFVIFKKRHGEGPSGPKVKSVLTRELQRSKTTFVQIKTRVELKFAELYTHVPNQEATLKTFQMIEVDWTAVTSGKELGVGSFGTVRLAHISDAIGQSKVVALKVLSDDASSDDFVQFFVCARLLHSLTHSNIIALVGFNMSEEAYFMALEMMDQVRICMAFTLL